MIAVSIGPRRRKVITGCTDFRATKALADKLQNEMWQRASGLVDPKADRYAALRPYNITAFTEDFRRNGAHYNHCPTVSTALLKAASQLPDLSPTRRTAIKAVLGAAQEGGFVLPSDVLANLL